MDEPRTLEQHLFDLESRLLDSTRRREASAVAALLSDDFVEIGSTGRMFNKSSIIGTMSSEVPVQRGIASFKLHQIAEGVALVTYVAISGSGPNEPLRESMRSSVWKREGTEWRMVFHQGTLIAK
ncbi:DUF4440 domain-containing protein [Usitatibacter palustris]|uniref:DUF4440 domain-containing protein n=1 Tax=Usitatibacter palustris TaxID=2732487 RepID=A0A6M4H6G4_9PROT|nr:DUF4440 domain-containing protein [Usitatibacter palustris]QJR13537.1 hypothetical protein DSM104440_00321 [Usitatibacter palustris]